MAPSAHGLVNSSPIIRASGVMASPTGQWLGVETDRVRRVKVNPDLSVSGHPEIFALGDTACFTDGRPLPGVAAAKLDSLPASRQGSDKKQKTYEPEETFP